MTKNHKIKFFSLVFISSLLLSGCLSTSDSGGSGPKQEDNTYQQTLKYINNQFSFNFPEKWDLIEPKDFTSEIPQETQVVVRNNIKNETFTANVNIVRNPLQENQSSLDYAKAILNRQQTGLLDYTETKRELVNINIGGKQEETYYIEFNARLNATDPINKFAQSFGVKDKNGYIILASYSPEESSYNVEQLKKIIQSFSIN